jgi:hypothetical protein
MKRFKMFVLLSPLHKWFSIILSTFCVGFVNNLLWIIANFQHCIKLLNAIIFFSSNRTFKLFKPNFLRFKPNFFIGGCGLANKLNRAAPNRSFRCLLRILIQWCKLINFKWRHNFLKFRIKIRCATSDLI